MKNKLLLIDIKYQLMEAPHHSFMNLTEDLKPLKKINTGVYTQAPKTKPRAQKAESNGKSMSQPVTDAKKIDDSFHYLVEETEFEVNGSFNSPTINVVAWNINGVRAMSKKSDLKKLVQSKNPDILCFYELKCDKYSYISQKIASLYEFLDVYPYRYFNFSQIVGYAGVAVYSKIKPLNYSFHLDDIEIDRESRFIKLEFNTFHFISVYVPTSGENLKRLDYRIEKWEAVFREYCINLRKSKPVVIAGDMNVAHHEIDIHNPKVSL